MKAKYLVVAVALGAVTLLAACGTRNVQIQKDRELCAQYGYEYGTNPFAKCVQDASLTRQRRAMASKSSPQGK